MANLATKQSAKEATEEVRSKFNAMQTAWWELGCLVRDCLAQQVPATLGMTAIAWLKSTIGESSVSKVYRALRTVKALDGLPEEDVKMLTEGKAYNLTRIPPNEREEWLEKALTVDNQAFQGAVEAHLQAKTGLALEPRVKVSVSLEQSVAELWKAAEQKVADVLEIDIETRPGLREKIFEGIASLVNNTDEIILRAEMIGDDGSEVPLG